MLCHNINSLQSSSPNSPKLETPPPPRFFVATTKQNNNSAPTENQNSPIELFIAPNSQPEKANSQKERPIEYFQQSTNDNNNHIINRNSALPETQTEPDRASMKEIIMLEKLKNTGYTEHEAIQLVNEFRCPLKMNDLKFLVNVKKQTYKDAIVTLISAYKTNPGIVGNYGRKETQTSNIEFYIEPGKLSINEMVMFERLKNTIFNCPLKMNDLKYLVNVRKQTCKDAIATLIAAYKTNPGIVGNYGRKPSNLFTHLSTKYTLTYKYTTIINKYTTTFVKQDDLTLGPNIDIRHYLSCYIRQKLNLYKKFPTISLSNNKGVPKKAPKGPPNFIEYHRIIEHREEIKFKLNIEKVPNGRDPQDLLAIFDNRKKQDDFKKLKEVYDHEGIIQFLTQLYENHPGVEGLLATGKIQLFYNELSVKNANSEPIQLDSLTWNDESIDKLYGLDKFKITPAID